MKILHISDIHLDFFPNEDAGVILGQELAIHKPDHIIITGDIANGSIIKKSIEDVYLGANIPISYCVGNHDFYYSSFDKVFKELSKHKKGLVLVDNVNSIPLTDTTCIVGESGFFDAIAGDPVNSNVLMNDFDVIIDLIPYKFKPIDRIEFLRDLGKKLAQKAENKIRKAFIKYDNVIFLTHYPPFHDCSTHKGKKSDKNWAPWFTFTQLGDVLIQLSYEFSNKNIDVYCGHTHDKYDKQIRSNLSVHVARSQYKNPMVNLIFEI